MTVVLHRPFPTSRMPQDPDSDHRLSGWARYHARHDALDALLAAVDRGDRSPRLDAGDVEAMRPAFDSIEDALATLAWRWHNCLVARLDVAFDGSCATRRIDCGDVVRRLTVDRPALRAVLDANADSVAVRRVAAADRAVVAAAADL